MQVIPQITYVLYNWRQGKNKFIASPSTISLSVTSYVPPLQYILISFGWVLLHRMNWHDSNSVHISHLSHCLSFVVITEVMFVGLHSKDLSEFFQHKSISTQAIQLFQLLEYEFKKVNHYRLALVDEAFFPVTICINSSYSKEPDWSSSACNEKDGQYFSGLVTFHRKPVLLNTETRKSSCVTARGVPPRSTPLLVLAGGGVTLVLAPNWGLPSPSASPQNFGQDQWQD